MTFARLKHEAVRKISIGRYPVIMNSVCENGARERNVDVGLRNALVIHEIQASGFLRSQGQKENG
ncbi:hypothetical protein E2C01_000452 [Portunus trituberculatus]|uniref:Uncharacterized protein n=1 Tax=Portunus trituberculatus TaxID=210409 RepID=A0A5B7CGM3_PORTR|nr:hypothetical protein [Portunus trituberculatus]